LYATNEIVENALKKAHLFFLLVGEVGAALCGDVFILFLCSYVFPHVPQVLHVFSIASHFFFHVVLPKERHYIFI
jgi:hypothetical protein